MKQSATNQSVLHSLHKWWVWRATLSTKCKRHVKNFTRSASRKSFPEQPFTQHSLFFLSASSWGSLSKVVTCVTIQSLKPCPPSVLNSAHLSSKSKSIHVAGSASELYLLSSPCGRTTDASGGARMKQSATNQSVLHATLVFTPACPFRTN